VDKASGETTIDVLNVKKSMTVEGSSIVKQDQITTLQVRLVCVKTRILQQYETTKLIVDSNKLQC
jgi:hypothetical protein